MSDLASQFEKITMAHAFLDWVNRLLAVACAFLVKDSQLAVTAIFQMWLQWFKTMGSGVEWLELATIYPFDVHFAPVNPSLEFLMDNLTAEMMVSALVVTSASDTAKHPVGALVVVRGEGQSKGCRGKEAANHGDIQEAGPLTPKAVAGGIARELATSPQLVTTPRSKGKGKTKAQDKEDEDIEEQIEETCTDKCLATLLHWQKAQWWWTLAWELQSDKSISTCKERATTAGLIMTQRAAGTQWRFSPVIIATAQGRAVCIVDGAKKIVMKAALVRNARAFMERQRELVRQGEPIEVKHSSLNLLTLQEELVGGGSGVTKVKSRELVESNKDNSNNNSDGDRPQTIASEEGEGDMEMREMTPLVMVTKVEWEASNMEIKGEGELEVVPVATEEDKKEEIAEEVEVRQWGTWSDTPLHQVGNNKLEWLGEDLG
ncbi:hypothetical protein E4T56_gene2753 [Termitomyces sp. T112]|nr:hypothetical protein E4T56_gene2753 [Termitomyces sp. T112]